MTATDGLPPLREVIAQLQLSARKSLGQNFILDLNLTRRIARAAGPLSELTIIEVGPGPGGLTRALLSEGAGHVIAVERDARCIPALEQIAQQYPGRLEIINGDALEVDYESRCEPPCRIVANLPYGIATTLLTRWLSDAPWPPFYDRMVLMFQREVAERIVSEPGGKSYGRLSVLAQWRCEARILFTLPPRAFTPPPKVESAVVELLPRPALQAAGSLASLEAVTSAAFGQRRKMLRASLKSLVSDPVSLLQAADIDPTWRAENLSVLQFCALARRYHDTKNYRSA